MFLYSIEVNPKSSVHGLGRTWRPDLYVEIAKFLGRMTVGHDMYCRGFDVGEHGQFIAKFSVPRRDGGLDCPITYEMDHGRQVITSDLGEWKAKEIVPLRLETLNYVANHR